MIDGNMVMFEPVNKPIPKTEIGVPVFKVTKATYVKNLDQMQFKAEPVAFVPFVISLILFALSIFTLVQWATHRFVDWLYKKFSRTRSKDWK